MSYEQIDHIRADAMSPVGTLTQAERAQAHAAAKNNWDAFEAGILAALAHCEKKNELMLQVLARVKP